MRSGPPGGNRRRADCPGERAPGLRMAGRGATRASCDVTQQGRQ